MSNIPLSEWPERNYRGNQPATEWQDPAAPPGWRGGPNQPPPAASEPAPPGAWRQGQPNYADPTAVDPAYQAAPPWRGDPGPAGYRQRRMKRTGPNWITVAPGLFASLAISIGVVVFFIADLFVALGAPAGTSGRDRLVQFLAPADLATAAALVLAVALVVLQRLRPPEAPVLGPRGGRVRTIALLAGGVAAVVALAALVRGVVSLTYPAQPGAVKIGNFIAHLAVVLVASAAAAWSLRTRW